MNKNLGSILFAAILVAFGVAAGYFAARQGIAISPSGTHYQPGRPWSDAAHRSQPANGVFLLHPDYLLQPCGTPSSFDHQLGPSAFDPEAMKILVRQGGK